MKNTARHSDYTVWAERCQVSGSKGQCGNRTEWPVGDGGRCMKSAAAGVNTVAEAKARAAAKVAAAKAQAEAKAAAVAKAAAAAATAKRNYRLELISAIRAKKEARAQAEAPVKAKKDYCLQKGWGNKTVNVCADARKYYKDRGWSWIAADVPEKCYRAGFRPIVNGAFASKPNRFACFPTVAECIQAVMASGQGDAHPGSTQSVGNLRRGAKTHTAYYLNKLKSRNKCQPYPK